MYCQATLRRVTTAAFEMAYVTFGRGERPLVILPGMSVKPVTHSAAAVAGAYRAFGEEWTVYLFDRKENIQPGYTVADMAEDTAAAMRALGLSGADVFGVSQGGMMALLLAARHPELVRRLVVGSALAKQNETSAALFTEWRDLALSGDVRALNRSFFNRVYSEEYRRQYGDAFALLEGEGTPEELRRFAVLAEAARCFDGFGELKAIRCPVLVLGSEKDEVLTPEASREIAGALACGCYMYEGYGHAVYDEAPDYKQRLLDFFRGGAV